MAPSHLPRRKSDLPGKEGKDNIGRPNRGPTDWGRVRDPIWLRPWNCYQTTGTQQPVTTRRLQGDAASRHPMGLMIRENPVGWSDGASGNLQARPVSAVIMLISRAKRTTSTRGSRAAKFFWFVFDDYESYHTDGSGSGRSSVVTPCGD